MTLSIRDWDKHFEVSQSRRVTQGKPLAWVAMPTKQDGKGYRRLQRLCSEKAPSVFGVWCAIVQLCAKMPRRGVLEDDDGPLTCEDISDATGFDIDIIEYAVNICKDPKIGWLQGDIPSMLRVCSERGESIVYPQDRTGQDKTLQSSNEDKESGDSRKATKIDYESYSCKWNKAFPVRKVRSWSKERKAKLRTRLNEESFNFDKIIAEVERVGEFAENGGWFTLDWVLKNDTNYLKLLEGNYRDKPKAGAKEVPAKKRDVWQIQRDIDGLKESYGSIVNATAGTLDNWRREKTEFAKKSLSDYLEYKGKADKLYQELKDAV